MTGRYHIPPGRKTKPYRVRQYNHLGIAGLVLRRKSRWMGRIYSLYHAAQAGMDDSNGPWVTVCEEHGTTCSHATYQLAEKHLPYGEWCEECQNE